ncbi:hypothetical protein [Rhizobium sp. Rhizsp82]|uniref:hypothetical protein n=1 Tax=Rhizobium sp. Rhizsp82 TaxID=3243057 RepID=UPI0039B3DD8B
MIVEDPEPGQDAIKESGIGLLPFEQAFAARFRAQRQLLAFVQRPITGAFESVGALLAAR